MYVMDKRSGHQQINLGLIGWPVDHSLSPRLHQAALTSAGLTGEYRLYPVENDPGCETNLKELVERVRSGELTGLNVTIPHKQQVLPLMDELSGAAREIGAVNTIYARDGMIWGDNTDADGFLHDLRNQELLPSDGNLKVALVLGAGGAARAVVYALLQEDWRIVVSTRRVCQAEDLIRSLPRFKHPAQALPLDLAVTNKEYALVVNTTPLGMEPDPQTCPWPESIPFPPGACIYDLIYAPRETRLVRLARQAGLPAANGLGMLVEQAAQAFEIWTGQPADRLAMKAAVE